MVALVRQSNIISFPACEPEKQGKSNEWYTPSRYIEAARRVMGSIDLDPASCTLANETVKASRYYSKEDNGLAQQWYGNVWLNPPYDNPTPFIKRICQEKDVKQAIILTHAFTDTGWFRMLWSYLICFHNGRINFSNPFMPETIGLRARHPSCFVYLGPNESAFIREFSQFGTIAKAIAGPRRDTMQASLWEVQA